MKPPPKVFSTTSQVFFVNTFGPGQSNCMGNLGVMVIGDCGVMCSHFLVVRFWFSPNSREKLGEGHSSPHIGLNRLAPCEDIADVWAFSPGKRLFPKSFIGVVANYLTHPWRIDMMTRGESFIGIQGFLCYPFRTAEREPV